MNIVTKMGCIFYAIATATIAVQQMFYADFCPIFFPPWPNPIPGYALFAYLFSLTLMAACFFIIRDKNAYVPSLLLGGLLLLMLFLGQVPWEYLVFPHKKTHLGVWGLPLKELAWAGGAFCIAGAVAPKGNSGCTKFLTVRFLEKLVPFGPLFFSTTMILFGVCHILYTQGIADMVPAWIPWHFFWTYFSAVALIAAGVSIIIRVWIRISSLLLGIMIFLWFVLLHIPGALKYPFADKGNLVFSAFSALAFSGIALVIAGANSDKKIVY
ncbi:DoxX family protein [Mucilaginibacter arboris]|uniref:DoxX family protein n=1 Tax=Mucilaginibacter arboris TaxID=2682090 RepID=A0A7K1SU09_9SPHI|nr:hypothetical protein [Mucilaginibacter arboris]MVN20748.1 hypothetical protein [Mucilaginibacter arboris]